MRSLINQKKTNIYLIGLVLIFFFSINVIHFFLHLTSNIEVSEYAYNELFINYQAGFIRRGLLGEFAWQLNDLFSINPKNFFSFFFLLIYLAQTFIFFYLLRNYIISKSIFIFIFFSPALILFQIYDPNLYYIKDGIIKFVVLLHAFIFYHFIIVKKEIESYLKYLKFLIIPILILTILTHEYQIFSIGIHYLISLGIIKSKKENKTLFKIFSILTVPIFLVLYFNGNQSQLDSLNLILTKFDVELNNYLIGSFYRFIGGTYKWHFYYFSYSDFIYLLISFFLGVYLFYLLLESFIQKKILKFQSLFQKRYHIYFIPCFIPFLITSDHGRDFSLIAFYLVAFLSTLNLNKIKFITFNNSIRRTLVQRSVIFFFLVFYVFLWKLDQFAGFELQGKPNGIFKSSLFAEFVKLLKFLYFYIDIHIIDLPEIRV